MENYHTPISIADIAAACGMSFRGFHQAFVQHTGSSPGETLRVLRIERAKEFLRNDYRIRTAAVQSGYRTLSAFDIAFKKATGLTPMRFQTEARRMSRKHVL